MMQFFETLIRHYQPAPKSDRWEDYFHGREEVIWSAAPLPTPQITFGKVALSIFGLPFLLAGLAIAYVAFSSLFSLDGWASVGLTIFLFVFSLPFIAVGVALSFGTWVLASMRPKFVRYALSNKRAYIASSWWNHRIESYPIGSENHIELVQGKSDTVYFANMTTRNGEGDEITSRIGFEHIADGAAVYALLRDLQQKAIT